MADRALIHKNTNQKDLIDICGAKPRGDDLSDGVCRRSASVQEERQELPHAIAARAPSVSQPYGRLQQANFPTERADRPNRFLIAWAAVSLVLLATS
jgi:hypothetical protein